MIRGDVALVAFRSEGPFQLDPRVPAGGTMECSKQFRSRRK